MEINILKERDTPLLSRKRYTLEIVKKDGPTPTRMEVKEMLAVKLKADKDLVVVKHVYPRYGISKTRAIVQVYEKKEDMERYESEGLLKKHVKETKKEEKAKAPEKPAEAPAEEKAEEKAEEAPAKKDEA
ncbi:hypothetical protein ACFL0V_01530 [Nanoarchaeota archaeon]